MIYALVAVILIQQISHYFERKDLYNRIMSKSLTEYKDDGKTPHNPISAHRKVLDRWKQKGGERQ